MPDNPIARRLITIPAVVVLFVLTSMLLPFLALVAIATDLVRSVLRGTPWISSRILAFAWVYLLGQMWALLALLFTSPLPRDTKERITYELQEAWTSWNVSALLRVFSLRLEIEGEESARHGPILLLSRHTSMVDTMLPAAVVANPYHLRLRYVLKRELLVDPTLDVAGHRIPNYFIDRGATRDSNVEVDGVKGLATDLGPDEGVLIYPEGSRFSEAKRTKYVERVARRGDVVGEIAAGFRQVLPPRPGGTLALLDATTADVVLMAHHGLEGLATVSEIWSGRLVDSIVKVHLWRIPRDSIPEQRRTRIEWLYRVWSRVDEWVVDQGAGD